jgi:hypothetical protein
MQRLQHITADLRSWLFYAIDDVGLQAEFLGKDLHNNTALAVIGGLKNDAPGFMKHDE